MTNTFSELYTQTKFANWLPAATQHTLDWLSPDIMPCEQKKYIHPSTCSVM